MPPRGHIGEILGYIGETWNNVGELLTHLGEILHHLGAMWGALPMDWSLDGVVSTLVKKEPHFVNRILLMLTV